MEATYIRVKNILELLEIFTDLKYQKRVWVEGKGPEMNTFDETMCMLYEDMYFKEFVHEEMADAGFSFGLKTKMEALDALLPGLWDEDMLDADLLKDPRWQMVLKISKEIVPIFEFEIGKLDLPEK